MPESYLTGGLTGNDADSIGDEQGQDESQGNETTLYFAGEAFDDLYNGWVQGGYRSGERVANQILADNL